MGLPEQFDSIAPQLNGVKYLVRGNHDKWSVERYEQWGFRVVKPYVTTYRDRVVWFSHKPHLGSTLKPDEINCHGHLHGRSFHGQTMQHLDVGVDGWWGHPLDTRAALDSTISRLDHTRAQLEASK